MMRVLFGLVLGAGMPLVWGQVEGRYHFASLAVKPGVAFEARVRSGALQMAPRGRGRFQMDHPAAPGTPLSVAASLNGSIIAGTPASGTAMELFVALRAPAAGQPAAALTAGDWSAAMVSMAGGKPSGLATAFIDFKVSPGGVISDAATITHEAAVDDVSFTETPPWRPDGFVIRGIPHEMLIAADGDMFLAVATAQPSLVIALRRDRDATTATLQGFYALSEIGARNSFAFAPEQARFFSTQGTLNANAGSARLSQRITLADNSVVFDGTAAYMLTAAGGGTFSPRLEKQRRNLALAGGGQILITAQVGEPGQLALLHGVGVGVRVLEGPTPVLAPHARAEGNVVSLYGRNLEDTQVTVDGQPAQVMQAWPNQINIRLAKTPAPESLTVELGSQGRKHAPVPVALNAGAAPPVEYASAPAAAGGFIAPPKAALPGETIELAITGAPPPAGFAILFDGLPGQVVSSAPSAGATRYKVTLPKTLAPAQQVNVALSSGGFYADLGDIAVSRPAKALSPTAAAH